MVLRHPIQEGDVLIQLISGIGGGLREREAGRIGEPLQHRLPVADHNPHAGKDPEQAFAQRTRLTASSTDSSASTMTLSRIGLPPVDMAPEPSRAESITGWNAAAMRKPRARISAVQESYRKGESSLTASTMVSARANAESSVDRSKDLNQG
jgi:hypothetical protein